MAKPHVTPACQPTALTVLTATVVGVVVIGGLYWAQTVLIPVALAMFLAFLLAPVVAAFQRRHVGRRLSVVVVVLFAALLLGSVIWVVKFELSSLANELPTYTVNIQAKVRYLRQMSRGTVMERLGRMTQDIAVEWEKALPNSDAAAADPLMAVQPAVPEESTAVEVPLEDPVPAPKAPPQRSTWLSQMLAFLSQAMSSLGGLALALVLAVFMLLERESLRNRLIRLVGDWRMTTTTKALDDAAGRISHYLLMQFAVNASYGITWGLGLFLLGVDYALLWGFLSAVLRYVPYLGPALAALLPITLSLAQFPGWWQPLLVIGLFLVLELVSNNVLEPWLYGQSIGVSVVAMLVAVAFWTFLWGPIGLVLSGPLTICLMVLAKHVPGLEFFTVLLGDEPALDSDMHYYQRLLARDQDEAARLVSTLARHILPEQIYDKILVPALVYTKRDRERDFLTEADEQFVFQATREVLEDLGEHRPASKIAAAKELQADGAEAPSARIHIMASPARDHADRLALEMLQQLLDPALWDVELTALEMLTAELVAHVTEKQSAVICIGALPPGGLAHTRHLCKRLRARHPDLKILVGRWGLNDNVDTNREELHDAGADLMATTLLETRKQLNDWLPVLAYDAAKTATEMRRSPLLPA